ncbi:amino acid adenylation domain-containing protein [Streptomyces coeruleorubidus]|uniref:amino acid adenylation domain-containing protein n=1 Tax=Streptomyces coeruleorubidus TaxID=116188 RepID=UPI003687E48E
MSDRLAAVPAHLREELLRRLAGQGTAAPAPDRIGTRARPPLLPLSSGQQSMWFLTGLNPEGSEYTSAFGLRLRGALDTRALAAAVDLLVERHEVLRTTYRSEDGRVRQLVHAPETGVLTFAVPAESAESAGSVDAGNVETVVREELARPFDLDAGPLLRARLFRAAPEEHILLITAHHSVIDGWSSGVLFNELGTAYAALAEGTTPELPPVRVQYADYALWQREWLAGKELDEGLSYWKERLHGAVPLDLPADRPRPAVRGSAGAVFRYRVPAPLTERLKELAHEQGTTLFVVLMAGFQLLAARSSGQRDVTVGTVTSGRGRPELERAVGFFVNTIALRTRVDESEPFTGLLAQVREHVLNGFEHDEVPFERVVEALEATRDPSRTPVFQTMLFLQNAMGQLPELPGVTVETMELPRWEADYDLSLEFQEADGGLDAGIQYSTELFDEPSVAALAEQLVELLDTVCERPQEPLRRLPLGTRESRARLRGTWDATRATAEADPGTVVEAFERQAARTPDAIALVDHGEELTFAGLSRRANRLAHHLIGRGVGAEDTVVLALPRTAEFVVAFWAVLKAGSVAVPVNTGEPAERVADAVRTAAPALVLTSRELRAAAIPATGAGSAATPACLVLDEPGTVAALAGEPDRDPDGPVRKASPGPANAACVVHTSGSTGRPQAVVVEHRALANQLVRHQRELFGPAEESLGRKLRVALNAGAVFDPSWNPLFWLADGHTLVLLPDEVRLTGEDLVARIREQRIDLLQLTPTLIRPSLTAGLLAPGGAHRPSVLVLGGEAVDVELWRELSAAPGLTAYSFYGPAECTVDTVVARLDGSRPPALGLPTRNTRAYVLDEQLRPVPDGVRGELYLAGDPVGRGYPYRRGLTAERFVADPFGAPGSRMYRTGDLVVRARDGRLEFLGRADDEAEIGGVRAEPGRAEAALRSHPAVRDCAVVVREARSGGHRLVAFAVPADGVDLDAAVLREHVRGLLPEPMIPAVFTAVAALPRTPGGKLDRNALPATAYLDEPAAGHMPARTPVEHALAEIWSELLGVDQVGMDDNFFALGGDSILSIQVVSRARAAGLRLKSKDILVKQTIARIAPDVTETSGSAPAATVWQGGPAPLGPIQQSLLGDGDEVPRYSMSLLVELAPGTEQDLLPRAVSALLEQHPALRTRFRREDGRWLQEVARETAQVYTHRDLSGLPAGEQEAGAGAYETALRETAAAARAEVDPLHGPLLRAVLLTRGPDEAPQLLLTAHHLVVDGVSWRILLDDLTTAYEQLAAGRPVDLGPATTPFTEWTARLADHVRSGGLDAELPYWTRIAEREPYGIPLDHDGQQALNTAGTVGRLDFSLDPEETAALLRQAPRAYLTRVDDLLLTALGSTLADWTGDGRVAIGMEGHGREEILDGVDLSRTVGWFTSLYPVELDLTACAGWGERVKAVKEQLRAVPGKGLGYGALAAFRPGGLGAAPPALPVTFNYHGQLDGTFAAGSLLRAHLGDPGEQLDADHPRDHLIEVVGAVEDGALTLSWHYSTALHDQDTVRRLGRSVLAGLREILAHCAAPDAGGRTPSDFPLVGLAQDTLDRLVGDGRAIADVLPLTPLQSGMLFHTLVDADSTAYVDQLALRLDGVTDPEALAAAWRGVFERTDVLRATVRWEGLPEPVQLLRTDLELPVTRLDWLALTKEQREAAFEELLRTDREAGIDLREGPLMRITLARVADDTVYLLWTFSHLLLDGWSTAAVFGDVLENYQAATARRTPALPSRLPFRDYLAWLSGQDREAGLAHWRNLLSGFAAPNSLLADHQPRASHSSRATESLRLDLEADVARRLADWCRGSRVTLNTLVQGAWATLLARHSGDTDVVFGAVVSGRTPELPGVEDSIGMFVNTIPVRVRLEPGAEDFGAWLRALQAAQAESAAHDYLSLTDIRRCADGLAPGDRLFDSVVVFENYPIAEGTQGRDGIAVSVLRATDAGTVPLTLSCHFDSTLRCELLYDPEMFSPDTAGRILAQLRALLGSVAEDPWRTPLELPWIPADERRLLDEWNDTSRPRRPERLVQELFEDQARRTPDRAAVLDAEGEVALTFRALDERANRLAHRLRSAGAGRGQRVALHLQRSTDMVTAVLAVLKAGAAYVPLDPEYPYERLEILLADAAPVVVLTQEAVAGQLPPTGAAVLHIDADHTLWTEGPSTAPGTGAEPDDPAYVVYTSGSTGQPKGVVVTHRNLVHIAGAWDELYDLTGKKLRFVSVTSLSVDLFFSDVLRSVFFGGSVLVVPTDLVTDPARLLALVERTGGTAIELVPSLAKALVEEVRESGGKLPRLDLMSVGSEGWHVDDCRELLAHVHPSTMVVNAYGATEATVDSTVLVLDPALLERYAASATYVPIGRPIANTTVHLLDEEGSLVPVGVPGQVHIGGDGVSAGYWNRPEMTAKHFVADPFTPGGRLYRPGDLARWRPDGTLEFLGRADHQVKIRGFRIEPGEVESALAALDEISEAVVVARRDDGRDRLVGYVVPAAGNLDLTRLRARLGAVLAPAMVPSAFVVLDRIPLLPSGKTDRRSLPSPEPEQGTAEAYVAPDGPLETLIADVWAQILGVERVGAADDFFALGGDSLLTIRVISRLRAAVGTTLSPRALFSAPTVRALAALVTEHAVTGHIEAGGGAVVPVPREEAGRATSLPLSFGQQRLWFLNRFDPVGAEYNSPLGLRIPGPVDAAALELALADLTDRHETLRTTFEDVQGEGRQLIHPVGRTVPLLRTDLSHLTGEEREARLREVLAADGGHVFDLRRGPLLRARLIRLAENEHVLTLCLHHIVTDGRSAGIMVRDLDALYRARLAGMPARLPEQVIGFADFAVWQRRRWDTEGTRQLAYWKERLDGLEPLSLPTDRPLPPVRSTTGAQVEFKVAPDVAQRLRKLSGTRGATLFVALVAATKLLLSHYSGQDDIAVGTVSAGRDRPEFEDVAGFFVDTLVLRSEVDWGTDFDGFLEVVRETVKGAFAHADVPFDRLVEALRPDRDPSRTPLFTAMVVLQDVRDELPSFGTGERVTEFGLPTSGAAFDLTFQFQEANGGLDAALQYSVGLFDASTAQRMVRALLTLLDSVTAEPHRPLRELPYVPHEPPAPLAHRAWHDEPADDEADLLPHQVIRRRTLERPDAVAVVANDGGEVTYAELEARADALARHLVERGVRPDMLVGVFADRSVDMVVGALAVLKAGGGYVPLDPQYPAERVEAMITGTAVPLVLAQPHLEERLPAGNHTVIRLSTSREPVAPSPSKASLPGEEDSPYELTADHIAYVVHTSGSTGRPKAVTITHGSIGRAARVLRRAWGITEDSRILQYAPASFDGGVCDLFCTLTAGATMCLTSPRPAPDPAAEVIRTGATVAVLPPALLAAMDPERLKGRLATIAAAGDVCSPGLVRAWAPGRNFFNVYGPSECTLVTTLWSPGTAEDGDIGAAGVPVGTPFPYAGTRVLDRFLRPVPVGVPGELYIDGPGLARGYARQPGLTAERFVADPYGAPGSRMYRTGDLVRRRSDGNLEFIGRVDGQVKVRGHRVEPGEIEALLLRQPGVADAAVTVWKEEGGRELLAAYVSPEPAVRTEDVDSGALRATVAATLPGYMVPATVQVLESLPLGTNGKVDRGRLPRPAAGYGSANGYLAPRNEREEILARVWAETLGIDRVGVEDRFFDLGGDSILSIQVMARARRAGLLLNTQDIFLHQTVAELAAVAELTDGAATRRPPAVGPVPLTPVQRWFFATHDVPHHFNQSTLVELRGRADEPALRAAFAALVEHHDALRMRYTRDGDRWSQQNPEYRPGTDVLRVVDASGTPDDELDALLEREAVRTQSGFALDQGPLLAAVLFDRGEARRGRLFVTVHHLVVDTVSWNILLDDLEVAYGQAAERAEIDLGPRSTTFQEWSTQLAAHVREGGFDHELPYWQGVDTDVPLPRDFDGSTPTVADSRQIPVRLTEAESALLTDHAPTVYRTRVEEVALSALARVLARWTGRGAVAVDLEGHGRERLLDGVDLSRTVGWFTSVYPVRLSVPEGADWRTITRSVRRQLRAVPNKGMGYGPLRHLRAADDGSGPLLGGPDPEVVFNFLGRHRTESRSEERHGQGLCHAVHGAIGQDLSPDDRADHILEIVGGIQDGRLEFTWYYSAAVHEERTIAALAADFGHCLRELARECAEAVR